MLNISTCCACHPQQNFDVYISDLSEDSPSSELAFAKRQTSAGRLPGVLQTNRKEPNYFANLRRVNARTVSRRMEREKKINRRNKPLTEKPQVLTLTAFLLRNFPKLPSYLSEGKLGNFSFIFIDNSHNKACLARDRLFTAHSFI
jgi:hypothetical protein